MGRRSDIKWNDVEVDFRLGVLSIRQIAGKHGIADSNLRARAKKEGWARDDGQAARIATREALAAQTQARANEIGAAIGAHQAQAYRQHLEETVLTAVEVTREHQIAARRGMSIGLALLEELEQACRTGELREMDLQRLRSNDAARAALIDRQLGIKARIEAYDRWASAHSKLAAAEREAHNIGRPDSRSELDDLLLKMAAERQATAAKSH
jgi:hypothetical protein